MTEKNTPKNKTSIRMIVVQTLIVCVSLVVALMIAEGVIRLKNSSMKNYDIEMWKYSKELKIPSENPVLGHEHRNSAAATLQSVDIRINSRGLRGGEVSPRMAGKRRILFIGSSITLGWGVKEEETMTMRLQEMFKRDGNDVEVLNAGIGNYNAVRYVERFLTTLTDLEPTDIVVHYFINDAEVLQRGGGNTLLRNSQLAALIWSYLQSQKAASKKGGLDAHYKEVYASDAPGYTDMKKALRRLSDYAREKGIRLHLAMMPDIHNLTDYKFKYIHEELKNISTRLGYNYIDLLPAFLGFTPEDIWSMPGDPHPNGLGHEIIAETLYPFLLNESGDGDRMK